MNELAAKAKRGDPDAFAELIQSQMQNMYKTARAILKQDADVADAISDTILGCWEQIQTLKNPAFFRTWMTRILINKCYDQIRKNKTISWEEYPVEQGYEESGFENIEWKETLDALPEKYRLAMMLYYVEGFKVSEISQILEISEGTVKSRLARGREQLTESFELQKRRVNA